MQIQEIMTRDPQWITPQTSVQEAAQYMQQQNIGSLLVGENDRLTGFITDRDIVTRAATQNKNTAEMQVSEVMTGKILYCFDDQPADWAISNMHENNITRLAVVNREKRLQGVVTHGDIARAVQSQEQALSQQVTEVAAQQAAPVRNQAAA